MKSPESSVIQGISYCSDVSANRLPRHCLFMLSLAYHPEEFLPQFAVLFEIAAVFESSG